MENIFSEKKGSPVSELFKIPTETLKQEAYRNYKSTPENMSTWLGQLLESKTRKDSCLKIPKTKIVMLDFEHWEILTRDGGNVDNMVKLNHYLKDELGDFEENKDVFLKTGIFSNKFQFEGTICGPERNDLGEKLYNMYYMSMMVGAHFTTEAVFREFVVSKEDVPSIYKGMPLHTEFRVFYDFEEQRAVGVSNYWHPEIMTKENLREDYDDYLPARDKIESEYQSEKDYMIEEVSKFMKGVSGIKGKWSVDVMKNGDDYWLIDMARMDRSSLLDVMETL